MDKKLLSLISILFLAGVLFISIVVFNKPIQNYTRAQQESVPSSSASLMFAYPLSTKVNDKVVVNIFVRNTNNVPIANRIVNVNTTLGQIATTNSTTNNIGQATFSLISDTPGTAELTAIIDSNIELNQRVTVKFEL
ncbi:hypothetical protein COW98_00585 [Candidatus Roizmanbacteria bacterium CG22_combo_CG10-13_8_21_14_all_35_9]|uniref:Big-1 domain-containing protein n=4 Tax=Candidatus Roizmaniibacteriota TaxID=1752723 RepID=A0A2M8F454_9BACT|nr:MAG: hypothetical protein COX47_00705 [Candidatus Roizmanbacteria bacterium CG23_combo_of_CG06-09_8_20_14_all_35_49]PIP63083.1 MAG: hypothetical protein COW98_00585 [Candidatus Roizmanbacteria bacterium CG22_combo_CG10-13_8_21_14_all_35_9]PIY70826.1 MAG: hypothetical protein COY88_03665 [Candidatus Roizmanbacteria bacterium CG_4_10_14_0_8_um_filter_35_28]PJC34031.1 MAG: hypothetical protein CO048_01565 [Candidatus Roizmanbacteria bacterium CG_4_9_14_0_2_um_filter_35_15]PJC82481.1 MAG: hypoth